tara:strand:- start:1187 stop:1840 length:654 start_codon:yes stop_codon:yes gene_type:complete
MTKDGNVAFKVTYTDSNWSGVCSQKLAAHNFRKRTWCNEQSMKVDNCQGEEFSNPDKVNLNNAPCYDCIALKELVFYPGHTHTPDRDNIPIQFLNAKIGKIAVFTSRDPGEPESERFIFAIARIDFFETIDHPNGPYETINCDHKTAIIFNNRRPKYWRYYSNPNKPEKIAWNTGLIRYLDDSIVQDILNDIIETNIYPNKYKRKAQYLLDHSQNLI